MQGSGSVPPCRHVEATNGSTEGFTPPRPGRNGGTEGFTQGAGPGRKEKTDEKKKRIALAVEEDVLELDPWIPEACIPDLWSPEQGIAVTSRWTTRIRWGVELSVWDMDISTLDRDMGKSKISQV